MKSPFHILILLLLVMLTSCTVHPGIYNAQTGEHVFLGGSFGSKTTSESAFAVSSSGSSIGYSMEGKDETLLPKYYFMEKAIGEMANAARQAFSSSNLTKRALGEQGVRRAGINANRAIQLKTLETALPEAAAPIIPTVP